MAIARLASASGGAALGLFSLPSRHLFGLPLSSIFRRAAGLVLLCRPSDLFHLHLFRDFGSDLSKLFASGLHRLIVLKSCVAEGLVHACVDLWPKLDVPDEPWHPLHLPGDITEVHFRSRPAYLGRRIVQSVSAQDHQLCVLVGACWRLARRPVSWPPPNPSGWRQPYTSSRPRLSVR